MARCIIILCILYGFAPFSASELNNSYKLSNDLLRGYNQSMRPVLDQRQPVYVSILLEGYIDHIDEEKETYTVRIGLKMMWTDENMIWDPENYGGMRKAAFTVDNVWYPPIVLFDEVSNKPAPAFQQNVRYSSHGLAVSTVNIIPSCELRLSVYSFYYQTCRFYIKPDGELKTNEIVINAPAEFCKISIICSLTDDWKVIQSSVEKIELNNVSVLKVIFTVKLKPQETVFHCFWHVVILSSIGIGVFLLPVETGIRVPYSLTFLLSFSLHMYFEIFSVDLPAKSVVTSVLGYYTNSMLILNVLICLVVIINQYLYFKPQQYGVPPRLGHIVCIVTGRYWKLYIRKMRSKDLLAEAERIPRSVSEDLNSLYLKAALLCVRSGWDIFMDYQIFRSRWFVRWKDVAKVADWIAFVLSTITFLFMFYFIFVTTLW